MATKTFWATITTTEDLSVNNGVDVKAGQRPQTVLTQVANLINGIAIGHKFGTVDLQGSLSSGAASGTLTLATASGTVGGTIGGTSVTVTASGGDTATATSLASAINANATASKLVTATSSGAVVTIKANCGGTPGNGIALVASGTGVTASGATLSGATANSFTN